MADMSALLHSPEKHPFQLQDFPGPKGPYTITQVDSGLFVRLDMPGVPKNGIEIFKSSEKEMVTVSAMAPQKESFPFDESERVYAGIVILNKDPNDLLVDVSTENGSVFLSFPTADGHLVFLPQPRLQGEGEGEGSSSGKSIDQAEGLEKSEENEDSSEKSEENEDSSEKSEDNEDSSEKSIDKAEGSAKSGSGENASDESTEGPGKSSSSKSSSNAVAEAWILASIKRHVLHLDIPEPSKDESALVETFPTEQSSHEVPQIAIGSVEEMTIHDPHCQCQRCDSDGVCLKTWSTTEDNIGHINKLKIKGPDGVCEKRVVQEEGRYSLYVRADLPGLEPALNVVTIEDRCILVFGNPQTLERCRQGARNYLFFVQLQCSCCKFDNLCQDYEDGVLRLFCKIIAPEAGPSAD